MTHAARITQADMERAIKAARTVAPDARIIIDLPSQRIEIILGQPPAPEPAEKWSDDDV
jgi:hypothetical protein